MEKPFLLEVVPMNHSRASMQLLDKAIAGFLYFKSAEGLADRSLDSYQRILNQCVEYWGPVTVSKLSGQDVSAYLSWLRTDYVPKRYGGKTHALSPKTLRNVWITLS